ncbi:hypothetical protein [Maritimibacter sp. UBA3975]|uniref:hypothetical protein n=1 Tax=Maritimibacter sp. UBA3975 TaxID=1946833 RepID=UPI000C09F12E|nr:hypothetical protein [Maritimibacter sp. UBA3975]MAM63682.1 hypothetical protein [Maritimibacter sp.]
MRRLTGRPARPTRVHLVSFADGLFAPRGASFLKSAAAFGGFESATLCSAADLDPDFVRRHAAMLKPDVRGYGYWIWKPQVTLQALERVADGDVVLYADAGCEFHSPGRARFAEYVSLCQDNPLGVLGFEQVFIESHWTKMDLALRLGIGAGHSHMKTGQLMGGKYLMRNSRKTRAFLREMIAIASEQNYHFIDDTPSVAANHPKFREHRHDQSIFSLLAKQRGAAITFGEGDLPRVRAFKHLHDNIPIWTMRHKT